MEQEEEGSEVIHQYLVSAALQCGPTPKICLKRQI
jgi:hypothetical protein